VTLNRVQKSLPKITFLIGEFEILDFIFGVGNWIDRKKQCPARCTSQYYYYYSQHLGKIVKKD